MKVGILSDIHGNVRALKAALRYLEGKGVNNYFFLGDYLGELPGVKETIDIIRALEKEGKAVVIKGNKEEYLLNGLCDGHPEWDEYKSVVGMLRYSASCIDEETKEYLSSLPISRVIHYDGLPEIIICHGSPDNSKKPVLSPKYGIDKELFDSIDYKYIIQGHTHFQDSYSSEGKNVWNPGTIGLPCNSKPETEFMIIEDINGEWVPQFVNLEYDYMNVIKDMRDCNLYEVAPYWTKATETLITGVKKVSNGRMLSVAMELCEKEQGYCEWPCVPERYMARAFEYLSDISKKENEG